MTSEDNDHGWHPITGSDPREFFFVFDKPHCVWSSLTTADADHFLSSLNPKFYSRLARQLSRRNLDNVRSRADAGGIARIFWHHAVETFVTMVGALLQAPKVPHAYFVLCHNEQVRAVAGQIQNEDRLPHEAVLLKHPGWNGLSRAVFGQTPWFADGLTVDFYSKAIREIVAAYLREVHRYEYNALKHGMRASIGSSRLEFGPPGEKPDGTWAGIGSRDSTHLLVLKPIDGLSAAQARVHHKVERVTVGWSLERTIQDLDLLAGMMGNIISLWCQLRGSKRRLQFVRVDTSQDAQEAYFAQRPELIDFVMRESFRPEPSAVPSAKEIKASFGVVRQTKIV